MTHHVGSNCFRWNFLLLILWGFTSTGCVPHSVPVKIGPKNVPFLSDGTSLSAPQRELMAKSNKGGYAVV
jgi:hypothetical protein